MRPVALVAAVAVLGSAATSVHTAPAARSAGAAVLDRTFSCSTALVGGIRQAKVGARRGSGLERGAWERPTLSSVSTSLVGAVARAIYDELAWVTAGRPAKTAGVIDITTPGYEFPVQVWGTLAVNAAQCRPSSAKVSLDRRGLVARDVGPFRDSYDCASPRIVVRIRAELTAAGSLSSYRGFLRTTVPAKRATLVTRTPTGKALAHVEVVETGKTRFLTAPSCFPD
jgi:hypothetical protein